MTLASRLLNSKEETRSNQS